MLDDVFAGADHAVDKRLPDDQGRLHSLLPSGADAETESSAALMRSRAASRNCSQCWARDSPRSHSDISPAMGSVTASGMQTMELSSSRAATVVRNGPDSV